MSFFATPSLRARVFAFPHHEILPGRKTGDLLKLFFEDSLLGVSGFEGDNPTEFQACFALNANTESLASRFFNKWQLEVRLHERRADKAARKPPYAQLLVYWFDAVGHSWLCNDIRPLGAGEPQYWDFDQQGKPCKGHVVRFTGEILTGSEVMGRMTSLAGA